MGKKSSSTPKYATTSYDTGGIFGSSTTGAKGTTFKPTNNMTDISNTAWTGLNNTLNSIASGDYSQDKNYQVYANNLRNQMSQNYDRSVLTPLANQGLMRSTGLQTATNSFADTLANQTANLYDSYSNRLNNNLSNYQGILNNLFNYITGVNTGSQQNSKNVSDYNMEAYKAQQQANSSLFSSLAQTAGTVAGAYFGGPMGATIGGKLAGSATGGK